MPRPFQLAPALVLTLLAAACSSAGSAGAGPATALGAAERQVTVSSQTTSPPAPALAQATSLPPSVAREGEKTPQRVATPLTVLGQMVTTQALLVSLLLAPVATEAESASTGAAPKSTESKSTAPKNAGAARAD